MKSTYFKTRKGQEEIDSRSGGLTPRARRLLIMFDGRRTLAEVRALIGDPNLDETLALLERDGYVETAFPRVPEVPPVVPETVGADEDLVEFDPAKLEMARNFMMNTLTKFHGPYSKLGLIKKVHESRRPEELRGLFDDWANAICETRMGKMRSEELKSRLREVLGASA